MSRCSFRTPSYNRFLFCFIIFNPEIPRQGLLGGPFYYYDYDYDYDDYYDFIIIFYYFLRTVGSSSPLWGCSISSGQGWADPNREPGGEKTRGSPGPSPGSG